MFLFLPLPLFILEVFIFWFFADHFGFWNTFFAYLAPTFLGIIVLKFQSQFALVQLQKEMMSGRAPGGKILHMAAKFVSGVLLMIPTFISRVFGVLLLLPISRHLIIYIAQAWLFKKLMDGSFRIFSAGGGEPFAGRRGYSEQDVEARVERDATVIDVESTLIEHSQIKNKD